MVGSGSVGMIVRMLRVVLKPVILSLVAFTLLCAYDSGSLGLAGAGGGLLALADDLSPTATPTPTMTRTPTRTVTPTPTITPTTTATPTATVPACPPSPVSINRGAIASTDPLVDLTLSATGLFTPAREMRFGADGSTWGDWRPYSCRAAHYLAGQDGQKTVHAQFSDGDGGVSSAVTSTIRLDTAAGIKRLVSINRGVVWTNSTGVTLTIGAPAQTAEMQISNDGGFGDADWQPFDTRPTWTVVSYGSYVLPRTVYVRLRGTDGQISDAFTDDIIYDPVPPVGAITTTLGGALSLAEQVAAQGPSINVTISARDPDDLSGVVAMRVGLDPAFAGIAWGPYAPVKSIMGDGFADGTVVYAQFRDGAGNESAIVCSRPDGAACFGDSPRTFLAVTFN